MATTPRRAATQTTPPSLEGNMTPTASRRAGTPLKNTDDSAPTSQPQPSPPPSQGGAFKKSNDTGAPSPPNPKILGFHPGYVGGVQEQDLDATYKRGDDARSVADTVAAAAGQAVTPNQSS